MRDRVRATPVFTALCVLIGVLVTIQLWLLSASVESVLAGRTSPAVAASIASAALFLANGGLLGYASTVDRRSGR